MPKRRRTTGRFNVVLPHNLVEDLDELADSSDMDRSLVIETILEDALADEAKLDELFGPILEDEEEEDEDQSD